MKHTLFALATFLTVAAQAQTYEAGLFLGASNYMGDLSPVAFMPKESHPAVGLLGRVNWNRYLSFKGTATYGRITGDDRNQVRPGLINRNLSFRSDIFELSAQAEWNILGFTCNSRSFTPYLFAGIASFWHNPKANYQGEWVALQPLSTEGQGTPLYPDRQPYRLNQFSIPFGIGMKYNVHRNWNIGLEAGFRKTFTDYLDDVSMTYVENDLLLSTFGPTSAALANRTGEVLGEPLDLGPNDERGNANNMDWYLFAGGTLTYTFGCGNGGRGRSGGGVSNCFSWGK